MIVSSVFLKITAEKLGEIKSGFFQRGREGLIPVLGLNHNIRVPIDLASGLPAGKRQHQPIIVTKEVDQTSTRLNRLLVTNERIKEAILTFYGPTGMGSGIQGAEQKLYTITLKKALITEIQVNLKSMIELKNQPGNFVETIFLVYNDIDWVWETPSFITVDQWAPPH